MQFFCHVNTSIIPCHCFHSSVATSAVWLPLNNSTYPQASESSQNSSIKVLLETVVPHFTMVCPVFWEWSYVCATDHSRKCSDKMWWDGEADWWGRAGVNPMCCHQLPDTFPKLSRGRLQNHPGELDCWLQALNHSHFTELLNVYQELTLNTSGYKVQMTMSLSFYSLDNQSSYWTRSNDLNLVQKLV